MGGEIDPLSHLCSDRHRCRREASSGAKDRFGSGLLTIFIRVKFLGSRFVVVFFSIFGAGARRILELALLVNERHKNNPSAGVG